MPELTQANGAAKLSARNTEMLNAVIEHLRDKFRIAAGPQVGGRKFYGRVTIETVWQDGECQEILPEVSERDRVINPMR